jgi:hypothetical protein
MTRRHGHQKRSKEQFVALPQNVIGSEEFIRLSSSAVRLLIDLARQYNGYNNGDFTAAFSVMENYGWRSAGTLKAATRELLEAEFIMEARDGYFMAGHSQCALYAITFRKIDECNGKLNISSTNSPPRQFKARAKPNTKPEHGHGSYRRAARAAPRDARGRFISNQPTD